jgi:DNA polymerase III sliding clamp (beta) subunit (PCNA family)
VTREGGRFDLDRIQIRGKQGQVIATDTKIALIYGGCRFPFVEDVLVPAIPLFGMKELQSQEVNVGRTATHLVITISPWTVWLTIQTVGKFPDVVAVIPRQSPTLVRFDRQDLTALLDLIADLPGAKEDDSPVTLDLIEW